MPSYTTWDGLEIAYQTWGEPNDAPTVVLHHGFVVDANVNWVAPGVVDALVAAGRHVAAPDARGHGASEKPHDSARYGESRMARDLGVLLDTLGLPQIDLVGYSMGGIVSLLFASVDERVRRLAVGGIGSGVVECGGVDRRSIAKGAVDDAFVAQDSATITDPGAKAFRTLADALGADRIALAAQAAAIHRDGVALDRIAASTLVFAGDADPLATRPEVLADAIPDATLQLFSGDHLSVFGDERLVPALVGFLA
ncbi:MAG TPA: alpha/beta hydrolase [Conexibacter sp.]|nr:alpha/beta hydrolase [Conexibacter sp.]